MCMLVCLIELMLLFVLIELRLGICLTYLLKQDCLICSV